MYKQGRIREYGIWVRANCNCRINLIKMIYLICFNNPCQETLGSLFPLGRTDPILFDFAREPAESCAGGTGAHCSASQCGHWFFEFFKSGNRNSGL